MWENCDKISIVAKSEKERRAEEGPLEDSVSVGLDQFRFQNLSVKIGVDRIDDFKLDLRYRLTMYRETELERQIVKETET